MRTRRAARVALIVLGVIALVLGGAPFLVPIPPLEGTRAPQELADPDSQFVRINNLNVHVKTAGQGEKVFILLHGFGASLYSWNAVMRPLSQYGRVIAFDRPAFGLTERPLDWQGENPYSPESQIKLVIGLMDHIGARQAILVGNSAGGTLAMQVALAYPDRVSGLVLVDAAVYGGGGAPDFARPLLGLPQMQRIGPLIARQLQTQGAELIKTAWHDPTKISDETLALYKKPLQVNDWDKSLWNLTLASQSSNLPGQLQKFKLPVLVITGDDDRIVPTEQSLRLAKELPNAQLAVISNAGHLPHEEKPDEFMKAVGAFLSAAKP